MSIDLSGICQHALKRDLEAKHYVQVFRQRQKKMWEVESGYHHKRAPRQRKRNTRAHAHTHGRRSVVFAKKEKKRGTRYPSTHSLVLRNTQGGNVKSTRGQPVFLFLSHLSAHTYRTCGCTRIVHVVQIKPKEDNTTPSIPSLPVLLLRGGERRINVAVARMAPI